MELGKGFAFIGKQYHLKVGSEDFYIDLLFYNIELRCYFVIELKTDKFKPEYSGKLNFYLTAVDNLLKKDNENPTIGILLCREKDAIVTEFSLKDINKPIGISSYQYKNEIPKYLEKVLPSLEVIKSRIKKI